MQQRNAAQFAVRFAKASPSSSTTTASTWRTSGPIRQPPGVRADHGGRSRSACGASAPVSLLPQLCDPAASRGSSRPAHGMVRPSNIVGFPRISAAVAHGDVRPIERRSGPHCRQAIDRYMAGLQALWLERVPDFVPHPGWWRGGIRLQAAPRSHSAAAVRGWRPDDRSASVAS